jgi:hypothetical protein
MDGPFSPIATALSTSATALSASWRGLTRRSALQRWCANGRGKPHRHRDKAAGDYFLPFPLAGLGREERTKVGAKRQVRAAPHPQAIDFAALTLTRNAIAFRPLPKGEVKNTRIRPYPDAYGGKPGHDGGRQ